MTLCACFSPLSMTLFVTSDFALVILFYLQHCVHVAMCPVLNLQSVINLVMSNR